MKEYIKPITEIIEIDTNCNILASSSYSTYRTSSDDYNDLKKELNIIKEQNRELINRLNSLEHSSDNNNIEN